MFLPRALPAKDAANRIGGVTPLLPVLREVGFLFEADLQEIGHSCIQCDPCSRDHSDNVRHLVS